MPDRTDVRLRRLARQWGAPPQMLDVLQNSALHQNLFGTYADQLSLLGAQRTSIGGEFKTNLTGIREQLGTTLSSAATAANERGVLGSSQDVQARNEARRQAALARSSARTTRTEDLLSNWAQVQQARRAYELGVIGIQQQRAAQQAGQNAASVTENVIDAINQASGYGGGGGAGGGGGGGASLSPRERRLTKRLDTRRGQIQHTLSRISDIAALPGNFPERQTQLNDAEQRLSELWRFRNRIRGRLDRDPIKRERMRKLLAEALNG